MRKILAAVLLVMATAPAFAISSDDLLTRQYLKTANSAYRDFDDSTLLHIGYVGSSTEAAVGITTDWFGTEAPIGTTDITFDMSAAAYDTLGELCDAIDAEADYTCALVDGKRDDDSSLLTDISTATASDAKAAGGYYTVGVDTGSAVSDGSDQWINRLGITPASGKRVVLKYCNVQNDAAGTLKIYGKLQKFAGVSDGVTRNDTTLVSGSIATANDTSETDGNIYGGDWLEFAANAHVVVSAGNASTAQTSTSFLECYWDEK